MRANPLSASVRVVRSVTGQYPLAMRREAVRIVLESLRIGEQAAKRDAPVRTGFMRNNIETEPRGMDGSLWSRASYSAHVNFGTRFMGARPFFTTGAKRMREHFRKEWLIVERRMPRL